MTAKKAERPKLGHVLVTWFLIISLSVIASALYLHGEVAEIQCRMQSGQEERSFSNPIAAELAKTDTSALENFGMEVIISFATVLSLVAFGFFAMYRSSARPLKRVVSALTEIHDENLSQTLDVAGCRELEQIGAAINGISSNLQEVLLLVWNHADKSAAACQFLAEALPETAKTDRSIRDRLDAINRGQQEICSVIKSFKFYDVTLDDDRVRSG